MNLSSCLLSTSFICVKCKKTLPTQTDLPVAGYFVDIVISVFMQRCIISMTHYSIRNRPVGTDYNLFFRLHHDQILLIGISDVDETTAAITMFDVSSNGGLVPDVRVVSVLID